MGLELQISLFSVSPGLSGRTDLSLRFTIDRLLARTLAHSDPGSHAREVHIAERVSRNPRRTTNRQISRCLLPCASEGLKLRI
jgi:hypothetical protein